jgi:phage-related protein
MKYLIEQLDGAEKFLDGLAESTQLKFAKVFRKVQEGHSTGDDFIKLPGTKGIFEFRVKDRGAWYRILAFLAHYAGDTLATVVATHGFKKKTNKTPQTEIEKAETIKKSF